MNNSQLISKFTSGILENLIKLKCLFQAEDPTEVRWAHISLLVEFAFELKKALQSINEQSFNHFVLKMGKFCRLLLY